MYTARLYRSWPRLFLHVPLALRLAICCISIPISILLMLPGTSYLYDGALMMLPIALSSWAFGKRGTLINLLSYLLIVSIFYLTTQHSLLWSWKILWTILGDTLAMLAVSVTVVSLRTTLTMEEEMERQVLQVSEQQRQFHQIKTQFIINVNHELRTPLAAAYGYFEMIQLIMEQSSTLDSSTNMDYIKHALRYCEDLRSMVNNVLDTIDIDCEHEPLQSKHALLVQLVRDICESIDTVHREKQRIQLMISNNLLIFANPYYVRDILYQLLTNAIKFSPETSPIVISAELLTASNEVRISVRDQGPGIPVDEMPQLFNRFVRLQRDIAGKVRGAGLGLYICKHMVEAMHGHIWVENNDLAEQGSCFIFTLPHLNLPPLVENSQHTASTLANPRSVLASTIEQ